AAGDAAQGPAGEPALPALALPLRRAVQLPGGGALGVRPRALAPAGPAGGRAVGGADAAGPQLRVPRAPPVRALHAAGLLGARRRGGGGPPRLPLAGRRRPDAAVALGQLGDVRLPGPGGAGEGGRAGRRAPRRRAPGTAGARVARGGVVAGRR